MKKKRLVRLAGEAFETEDDVNQSSTIPIRPVDPDRARTVTGQNKGIETGSGPLSGIELRRQLMSENPRLRIQVGL